MSEPFKPTWNAELYAKARPTYPAEAIEEILSAPRSSSSKEPLNVVDLGAGTGICTRMLIEACADDHSSHKLASISAFDASVTMLDQLNKELMQEQADPNRQALIPRLKQQKKLDASLKSHVAQATFENFNVSSIGLQGQVDLVVIAQAFHWCKDYNKAFENLAAALRPGGIVALIWNMEDRDSAHWVAQVRDLYEVYESGSPQYRLGLWRKLYDTAGLHDNFDIVPEKHYVRAIPTTVEGVCNRIESKSYIHVRPESERAQLRKNISDILKHSNDEELQKKWIDKETGTFEYPYKTDLYLFRRK